MPRRVTAVFSAAVLVILLAVPAQAAGPDPERARHERTIAYWTAERMASAVPRDFVFDPGRGFAPAAKPENPGKPGGGGGGGGGSDNVTGASWNGGGLIAEITGKVYFRMGSSAYVCSGAIVRDTRATRSLVLTAAHCAFDESSGKFATDWIFIPAYDASPTLTCANTKYGCWTASALVVHNGYASAGGFNTQATLHDWAFAVVGGGGHSGNTQLDSIGSLGATFSAFADGTRKHAFGFPAAQKYKGNDLTYCAGPIFSDPYNSGLTYGMTCDMTGGSSGGPWVHGMDDATTDTFTSVNSYGYSGVKAMHGPKFNTKTASTYSAADNATTTDVIVP